MGVVRSKDGKRFLGTRSLSGMIYPNTNSQSIITRHYLLHSPLTQAQPVDLTRFFLLTRSLASLTQQSPYHACTTASSHTPTSMSAYDLSNSALSASAPASTSTRMTMFPIAHSSVVSSLLLLPYSNTRTSHFNPQHPTHSASPSSPSRKYAHHVA